MKTFVSGIKLETSGEAYAASQGIRAAMRYLRSEGRRGEAIDALDKAQWLLTLGDKLLEKEVNTLLKLRPSSQGKDQDHENAFRCIGRLCHS